MNVLGSFSQMYMFILLVLLFLGSGFAIWKLISTIMERGAAKSPKVPQKAQNQQVKLTNNNLDQKGGLFMNNNGWLKLAVFSFVGILVSVVVLGLVSTNGDQGGLSIHQQHQQQQQGMQGGMNVNTPIGNMQMQGGMNGGMGMQNDNMMMQQRLNQMQQQLNQMQQQMGMMNGQNMGGMSGNNSGGMSGGMGMMGNMGGMNNMPQNNSNMSNMPQNNNSNSGSMSSGGGMSMM